MAGYNWSRGMSNNAVWAYRNGRMPISKAVPVLARKAGITQKRAREVLEEVGPCEWHHTSKYFNETPFYDIESCLDYLQELHEEEGEEEEGEEEEAV